MAAYQTAYHEGFLEKSNEYVQMAQLYLSVEAPYEAAKLLQKAMDEDKLDKAEEMADLAMEKMPVDKFGFYSLF